MRISVKLKLGMAFGLVILLSVASALVADSALALRSTANPAAPSPMVMASATRSLSSTTRMRMAGWYDSWVHSVVE